MQTTNGQAFEILMTLGRLRETGRLGFAIAKQRRIIETELREFIDMRNQAISRNMVDGKFDEESAARANAEIAEIVDLPCEFVVYGVSEDVFTSGNLTSDDMYALDFMVSEAE